jgi:hypothetical protein
MRILQGARGITPPGMNPVGGRQQEAKIHSGSHGDVEERAQASRMKVALITEVTVRAAER